MFQSTRPRGARPARTPSPRYDRKFQSTRPRGARRSRLRNAIGSRSVSIHAPARGATVMRLWQYTAIRTGDASADRP